MNKSFCFSSIFAPFECNVLLYPNKLAFKELQLVEYIDSIEVRANAVDKATSVKKIMESHGFETTYCFGDGVNDVDMLREADVGVAMGNACDALKEVSDVVIGRVDEDGIYNFLMGK